MAIAMKKYINIHVQYLRLKKRIRAVIYRFLQKRAYKKLIQHHGLYDGLISFLKSFEQDKNPHGHAFKKAVDFWTLYTHIKKYRPKEVLECGAGVSTFVLAYAIAENGNGRVTSVDELGWWLEKVRESLPEFLKKHVELLLREKVEHRHSLFRGARYKDIPDRPYDWIYIDGPTTSLGEGADMQKTFDADFLEILARTKGTVRGLIDNRKTTCWVLHKVIGKVQFDAVRNMGYILPCTARDLRREPDEFLETDAW